MIRLAVTGPESTGKSWLSDALAKHFQGVLVPEYAREYLESLNREYTPDDVRIIGQRQHQMLIDACESKSGFVVADTELLVISIWLEHKYGITDPWVEANLQSQPVDLYLLCDIDLPWEEDPLREHPHQREVLFGKYRSRLEALDLNYALIQGSGDLRLASALHYIQKFFPER
jgi:nicotinamide riboside kinase